VGGFLLSFWPSLRAEGKQSLSQRKEMDCFVGLRPLANDGGESSRKKSSPSRGARYWALSCRQNLEWEETMGKKQVLQDRPARCCAAGFGLDRGLPQRKPRSLGSLVGGLGFLHVGLSAILAGRCWAPGSSAGSEKGLFGARGRSGRPFKGGLGALTAVLLVAAEESGIPRIFSTIWSNSRPRQKAGKWWSFGGVYGHPYPGGLVLGCCQPSQITAEIKAIQDLAGKEGCGRQWRPRAPRPISPERSLERKTASEPEPAAQ